MSKVTYATLEANPRQRLSLAYYTKFILNKLRLKIHSQGYAAILL